MAAKRRKRRKENRGVQPGTGKERRRLATRRREDRGGVCGYSRTTRGQLPRKLPKCRRSPAKSGACGSGVTGRPAAARSRQPTPTAGKRPSKSSASRTAARSFCFSPPHGDGPCELHDGQIFRAIAAGAHELVQDKERTQAGILPGGGPRQCSEREIGFVQMKHIEEIADDGAASSLFAAKSAG